MVSAQSNNSGPLIPPAVSFTGSSVSILAEPRKSPTNTPDEADSMHSRMNILLNLQGSKDPLDKDGFETAAD